MPSIEELLAAVEEPEDDDTPETTTTAKPESSSFKELRDHAKRLDSDLRKKNKELDELRAYKAAAETEKQTSMVKTAFKEAGLNEKLVPMFLKAHADSEITPEAVRDFASVIKGEETETEESTGGFAPTNTEGGADRADSRKISREDFEKLWKTNPVRARQYLAEDRVKWNNLE